MSTLLHGIATIFRRTNEIKSEIDIPDDVIVEFKKFWLEFKETPLKGNSFNQLSGSLLY